MNLEKKNNNKKNQQQNSGVFTKHKSSTIMSTFRMVIHISALTDQHVHEETFSNLEHTVHLNRINILSKQESETHLFHFTVIQH